MVSETCEADDREVLVNLAIYDYHAAMDRGESPDPNEWAARNPEIAAELQAYFEDLAGLDLCRPPARSGAPGSTAPWREPSSDEPIPLAPDFQPGDVLGDYVLLEELGEGGQGVVWKARPQHAREIVVALKTLPGPTSSDAGSVHRLRADARAIARMKHPNIIQTSYFGEDRGRWFFVMELMEGGTVADRLESYRADPRSAAVLMEKIARAIHHAHTRNPGVLHLDLKPRNILLAADGEPKVTDFGLSVRFETIDLSEEGPTSGRAGDSNATDDVSATFARAGIVGTFPYISPEVAGGRWSEITTSSDVYGLGAILYTMLTGRAPFRGRDSNETLALVVKGELTDPREPNRRVDRELNAICLKSLDRDPNRRYGSADAFANDLRRWLHRRPTLAGGKPSVARELRFWMRRHPLGIALAAVTTASLWLAGIVVSVGELRAQNAREAERLARQVDRELRLIRRATQILARIWGGRDDFRGILVANFTIGSRMIDVDLRHEPNAAVLCPMDRSDPVNGVEDPGPPWRYIVVLDGRYTEDWKGKPFDVGSSRLPDFQSDPTLIQVTGGLVGGSVVDYHRVAETNMVVVMRRKCRWPLSWMPDFR